MTQKGKFWSVVGLIAIAVILVGSINLYYFREDTGGQLVWNDDEAYLFMRVARRGFHMRCWQYPWVAFKEWVNVPVIPSDERVFLQVVRVTPSGIERYSQDSSPGITVVPDLFTPIGQSIYANCRGTLCKWSHNRFENATTEERQKLDGINHLVPDIDTQLSGWTKHGVGAVAGDSQYSVQVGKDTTIVVKQGNVYKSVVDSATVELKRSGQASQQLWHVNGEPRRVSRDEYKQAFTPGAPPFEPAMKRGAGCPTL